MGRTDCHTGDVGHRFAMTFLGRAAVSRRRGTWVPPYGGMAAGGAIVRRRGGTTDCHSQCAHWLRNDRLQGMRGRRDTWVPPYGDMAAGGAIVRRRGEGTPPYG